MCCICIVVCACLLFGVCMCVFEYILIYVSVIYRTYALQIFLLVRAYVILHV